MRNWIPFGRSGALTDGRLLSLALAFCGLAAPASAQSLHERIEAFFEKVHAHIAQVQEQQAFDARAKHVGTRERVARRAVKSADARIKKLGRRIDGWQDDIGGRSGLSRRLRTLQNKARSVRGSTMRRRYGSLILDVRRKIAQREEWIERAEKDISKARDKRAAAEVVLEEARIIRIRMVREATIRQ